MGFLKYKYAKHCSPDYAFGGHCPRAIYKNYFAISNLPKV
jgi:hypothetical protein